MASVQAHGPPHPTPRHAFLTQPQNHLAPLRSRGRCSRQSRQAVQDPHVNVETLIAAGYFPKEYPPPFNTRSFAAYAATLSPSEFGSRVSSRPASHNLARPGGLRRRLHIPNPFSYLRLAHLLADHWLTIEQFCSASTLAVSTPVSDSSAARALRPRLDGADLAVERARVRRSARVILRTDIARFYNSIYTHSLPWALHGKDAAKRRRTGGLGNDIDERLRDLQDGQTLGIPVGPDTSLVAAEIVATAIDRRLAEFGLYGFRFIDDFEFGFDTRSEAASALATIEEVLSDFELAINPRKTSIEDLPVELERPWIAEIRSYPLAVATRQNLISFFNRVFDLKKAFRHDPVLAYAVSRLRSTHLSDQWPILRDILCQCVLAEPGSLESFVTLAQEHVDEDTGTTVDAVIRSVLQHQSHLSHGSEIAWALWAAIWFRRRIPTVLAKRLDGQPDPAVGLLCLRARSLGLIRRNVEFPIWRGMLTTPSLYGPMWLMSYEADTQGWLRAGKRSILDRDERFGELKRRGVSFFDSQVAAPTRTLLTGAPASIMAVYETQAVRKSPIRSRSDLLAEKLALRLRRHK